MLDDSRPTPADRLNDGQNYHPTPKWVLFGHHFAAISGAGPLIGPVLAMQFGYLPGLIWIVVGVCLAGAVQDMLVLAASVRRGGRSLAEIARAEIGPLAGATASITILFVVVIALAGLGMVVVKAWGRRGDTCARHGARNARESRELSRRRDRPNSESPFRPGARLTYPNGGSVIRGEAFTLSAAKRPADRRRSHSSLPRSLRARQPVTLPAGVNKKFAAARGARSPSPDGADRAVRRPVYVSAFARDTWSKRR